MRILCIPHIYICIYAPAYLICRCVHCSVLNLPIIPSSLLMHVESSILGCICHQLLLCPTVMHCHQSSTQSSHVPASQPPSLPSRTADSSSSPAQSSEGLHPQGTSCSHHRADKLAAAAQPAKQIHADSHARRHNGFLLSSQPGCQNVAARPSPAVGFTTCPQGSNQLEDFDRRSNFSLLSGCHQQSLDRVPMTPH